MASNRQKAIKHWYGLGQRRCYCGVQLNWMHGHKNSATFEHLVPKCKGGTYAPENGIIICYDCNQKRGNTDWLQWITENNPPKAAWLLGKYQNAINYYAKTGRKINVKFGREVHIHIENLIVNM